MKMTGRHHSLLAILWVGIGLLCACGSPGASAEEQGSSLEVPKLPPAIMERLEKAAADLRKIREELTGQSSAPKVAIPGEVELEVSPSTAQGIVGEYLQHAQAVYGEYLRQADAIQVDEEDMQGLEHYAKCEYDQAAALFEKSLAANPAKEFPAYFLACIAFERGKYGQAAERFGQVYKEDKACTTAYFLSLLSELCVKEPQPVGSLDIALLANQAATRVNEELVPPFPQEGITYEAMANGRISQMGKATRDAMVVRYNEALAPIRVEFEVQTAAGCMAEKDPQRQAALALMVEDQDISDALIARTVQNNPDAPGLRTLAFLARYFTGAAVLNVGDSEQFRKDLAEAVQREPDNGALLLLEIEQKPPIEVKVEGQSYPDYRDVPLTEEEIELLHRAAEARDFNSYRTFQQAYRDSYMQENGGGFGALSGGNAVEPMLYWNNTEGRIRATMKSLAAKGETERLVRLYDDGIRVATRINDEAPGNGTGAPTAENFFTVLSSVMYDFALRVGDSKYLDRSLQVWAQAIDLQKERGLVADAANVAWLENVPLQSLIAAELQAESPTGRDELYHRLLREKHAEYLKEALDQFEKARSLEQAAAALGQSLSPDPYQWDFASAAALLGDLGDPAGVPALTEMAGSKSALVAYAAKAALEKVKAGPQPTARP